MKIESGRIVLVILLIAGAVCAILPVTAAERKEVQPQPLQPDRAEVTLTGDTSEPVRSLFIPGQAVVLSFRVTGLPAKTSESLKVKIVDEQGAPVREYGFPFVTTSNAYGRVRYSENNGQRLWEVDVYPPTNRLGFFQAFASLSSGEELPSIASRPAGYLTYAIIPDPIQRKSYPPRETFFGMMGAVEPGPLGASWSVHNYRMYTWDAFEPERAEQFEEKVKSFEAEEVRGGWATMPYFQGKHTFGFDGRGGAIPSYRVLHIGTPPWWAARNETRGHLTAALTREGELAFREFCLKLGRYMAEHRADEPIHYYQITAEPEIPWGFKGTVDDLIRIYQIAYPALHEADPNAVVTGPTIGIAALEQNRELLKKGLGHYIDVLDFHPYMGGDVLPAECDLIGKIRESRAMVEEHAGKDLPFAGTESGFNATGETQDKWLRKAWSDVQHNLILLGEGFWLNIGFHGADMDRTPGGNTWGYFFNLDTEREFGIQKYSPKPVAAAYAAMSFLLEGKKTAGAIEWLGEKTVGYAYQRSNDVVLALWSQEPKDVAVPVGTQQVRVFDWMGNASTVMCPDGVINLTLGQEPHYIQGVSSALWGKDGKGKPLSLKANTAQALPGETITLNCQVAGTLGKAIKGQLVFTPDTLLGLPAETRAISVGKGANAEQSFTLVLPASTPPGRYPLSFVLLDNGTPVGGAGLTLRVDSAVTFEQVMPAVSAAGCGVAVTLKASPRQATQGKLAVAPTGGIRPTRELPFALKAGETQTFRMEWKEPAAARRSVTANLTATTTQGVTATSACTFDFITASRFSKPPVLDGNFSEWNSITPLFLSGETDLIDGTNHWQNAADLAATVRLGWDAQALYVACEVADDQHYQHANDLRWMMSDDSLMLAINVDPQNAAAAGSQNVEGGILRRWHEFGLAMRDDEPRWVRVGRLASYDLRFAPAGELTSQQLPHAAVRNGSVTRYEAAIPWSLLNADKAPAPGSTIGLALAIADADQDAGERTVSLLGLFGGVYPIRDIPRYGWVVLTP